MGCRDENLQGGSDKCLHVDCYLDTICRCCHDGCVWRQKQDHPTDGTVPLYGGKGCNMFQSNRVRFVSSQISRGPWQEVPMPSDQRRSEGCPSSVRATEKDYSQTSCTIALFFPLYINPSRLYLRNTVILHIKQTLL